MTSLTTELAAALERWGVIARAVERLGGGAVNQHWRVEVSDGARVLRRYSDRHDPAGTGYEHELLAFLAGRGWPVAAPIAAPDGATVVETDAGRWSLFPFLEGTRPPDDLIFLQRKGALLALLHEDMGKWEVDRQRPGFGRVNDLDVAVAPDGFESFDALIEWFGGLDSERARALAGFRHRNAETLALLGYDELPDRTIYNECFSANVLFEGDDVSALLDFDFAHRDARIADIGRSLIIDCRAEPWPMTRWVAGYQAHAEPRLSEHEADLLPAVMLANALWNTAVPLAILSAQPSDWMWGSVQASIDHELPHLQARQGELRRIVRTAAGYTTV